MKGIFNTSRLLAAALAVAGLFGSLGAAAADRIEFVHTDALGSPVAVTDESGVVIRRTEYEPYGGVIGGEVADGPGYTGHVSDSATGLSYMQQRYMDPELGVFLSVDPVTALSSPVKAFGRFRYAANNPYSFIDPDGRFERRTGSLLTNSQGFSGSRVVIIGSSVRSPLDKVEGGGAPRGNSTIDRRVVAASNGASQGSEARSAISLVGLVDAIKAKSAASDATEAAKASGLDGLGHGRGDAMRHCTWSCQMARDIGMDNARLIGDNHEIWGTDVPEARQMDLNNNAAGRSLSELSGSCSSLCTEAASNDQLDVYIGK